jgi:hypothetical protein
VIHVGHRFMTGQLCTTTGDYEFDGYADASATPLLRDEQRCISVRAGSSFPAASDAHKSAYWKFTGFSY